MEIPFRLHRNKLPGHPDIVSPRHRKVVFVHGCFRHGHDGCPRASKPSTHRAFWQRKIAANRARDQMAVDKLRSLGWTSLVVWECETKDVEALTEKLLAFLKTG